MKLILDLDTGIDDAMALAYAVGSPDLELIGVTGTYGNVYTGSGRTECAESVGNDGQTGNSRFSG
ncbi:MAG: nucleoside hydrolase [Anaerotignum sp.]